MQAVAPFPWRRFVRVYERSMREQGYRKGARARVRSALRIVFAGFSDAVENKILDHLTGKTAYASPGPLFMALLTTAASDTSTSASLVEATYTGYARKQIVAADWNAASAGAVATAVQEAFAACTAGTSTVIGWALSPVAATAGAGDVVMYGTCASVTISSTQTPATVAAGALSMSLD
jgi:hypothetical protein